MCTAKPRLWTPLRPGAGQQPPVLAGREHEIREFKKLLCEPTVQTNAVLTGLRGVGKTVLLDKLKPIAMEEQWLWVGTDLSESASLNESSLAVRLMADLAVVTSSWKIAENEAFGFAGAKTGAAVHLDYRALIDIYTTTPGLDADKLKAVLITVANHLPHTNKKGLIFAYDEAQQLKDHSKKGVFPLAMLLEVFQSIQKQGIPMMLLLTGLPTLFPNLVESRTFAERMFHVIPLGKLKNEDARKAVQEPLTKCTIKFTDTTVALIVREASGYPYFIQFICREVFDALLQNLADGKELSVPIGAVIHKLDTDFFDGRWSRATDRQRELLAIIASLSSDDGDEFSVQAIVSVSQATSKPFTPSLVNQMLAKMCEAGLAFKNRHGRYSFAVPLMAQFIRRQNVVLSSEQSTEPKQALTRSVSDTSES